jgi:hypothetical protein
VRASIEVLIWLLGVIECQGGGIGRENKECGFISGLVACVVSGLIGDVATDGG